MIRLHAKGGLLGELPAVSREMPWSPEIRPRVLLDQARTICPTMPRRARLGIAINGRKLEEDELDTPVPDNADVILAPEVADPVSVLTFIAIEILIPALVGAALGYVAMLLVPKPKPPGVPKERGDEESPSEGWSGIQTSYGPGLPVPIGYGRFGLGGQVISTSVFAEHVGLQREKLFIVLALGDGPYYRIGNMLLTERNGLGGYGAFNQSGGLIPSGIRINGNALDHTNPLPGAYVFLRPGTLSQSPLPTDPFRGAEATFNVGEELPDGGSDVIFTWTGSDPVSTATITIAFPSGIYGQDQQGNLVAAPVQIEVQWRPNGAGVWFSFFVPGQAANQGPVTFGAAPRLGASAEQINVEFQQGGAPTLYSSIEIRCRRLTSTGLPAGVQAVRNATWRQVTIAITQTIAYSGVALIGFDILATGRLQGGLPQFLIQTDQRMVKVWDASLGWSPPCWDVPAAPFNWMTYPPGRNPAWIAIDFLLNPAGLGRWKTVLDIDLPAFRRWSILCDQDPNPGTPWGEPAFCFDATFDSPRAAWERLIQIMAAGRAAPVRVGRKISVRYQYRDSHGDALVTVPAKTPVQLFTSGNVEDVEVTWLPTKGRSNVIQFQFQNEAKQWAQDVMPVQDDESTLDDPNAINPDQWRPEPVQAYGVTRESQLLREGKFLHRLHRLVRRSLSFKAGPWALALDIGDLFDFEHEVLRPFAADVPMSCAVRTGGAAVASIIVDHVVTGTGLQVVVRDPDGAPQYANINSLTAVPGVGTQLNLATTVTCDRAAPAVVGKVSKLTQRYECASITLAQDVKRKVTAVQWVPEVYDVIAQDDVPEDAGADGMIDQAAPSGTPPAASDLQVIATKDGQLVSWMWPGSVDARACRVWVQDLELAVWVFIDQTWRSELLVRCMTPFRRYLVAVAVEDAFGVFTNPEASTQALVLPEEFPTVAPPPARRLRGEAIGEGILFRWPEMGFRDLDCYEIRAGADWPSATVLWRGKTPFAWVRWPRVAAVYQVAPRSVTGLYGEPARLEGLTWSPPGMTAVATSDQLDNDPPGGTLTDLVYDGTDQQIEIDDDVFEGSYVSTELDPGSTAARYWQVRWDSEEYDNVMIEDAGDGVLSGEARWRWPSTRPPSVALPGVDSEEDPETFEVLPEDAPGTLMAHGGLSEIGDNTWCRVESRFHDGSTWGDWARHIDGLFTARKMQVRVTIGRRALTYSRNLTQLEMRAYGPGLGALATRDTVGTAQLEDKSVTNTKAAEMPANTVKVNATGGETNPTDFPLGTNTVLGRAGANITAIPVTGAGRDILDDANATDQRTTLGLGSMATQAKTSVDITGGTISGATIVGITDLAVADGGTGASTAAAARANLDVHFPYRTAGADFGTGIGALGGSPHGLYMDFVYDVMERACEVVNVTVNVWHNTVADPGNWELAVVNVDSGVGRTMVLPMSVLAYGNNLVIAGTLSGALTFAAGDTIRCYIHKGASNNADEPRFRAVFKMRPT